VLTGGAADAPERHRTLRAAIEWSHELLEPGEQAFFRRLSVFVGGWSLEAAEMVCARDGDSSQVMERLGDLVAKSIAVFYLDDLGEPRYRLLESLREFALERLREAGEEPDLRSSHRAWCLDLAHRLEAGSPSPAFPALLDEVERELQNMRETLSWALARDDSSSLEDGLSLSGLLWLFWDTRGLVTEGLEWLHRFLDRSPAPSLGRATALMASGWLSQLHADQETATLHLAESVGIFRDQGSPYWHAWALALKGMISYNHYLPEEAKAEFHESVAVAESIGYVWLSQGWCAYGLGHVAWMEGDLEEARRLITQTLDMSRENGLLWGIGHAQLSLSLLAYFSGELGEAATRIDESARIRQRIRDSRGIADCLGIMAVYASSGQTNELAARLLGAAELKREATGQVLVPWLQPFYEQAVATTLHGLGETGYLKFVAEGRLLSTDQAIDQALAGMSSPVGAHIAGNSG
jgi:non-specific serine/threonine protein kinase